MPALLQESYDGIHRRPNCLRQDNQENAFIVRPYSFPGPISQWVWPGAVLFIMRFVGILLRHINCLRGLLIEAGGDGFVREKIS